MKLYMNDDDDGGCGIYNSNVRLIVILIVLNKRYYSTCFFKLKKYTYDIYVAIFIFMRIFVQ